MRHLFCLLALLAAAHPASAQVDWRAELSEEYVALSEDKMTIDDVGLVKIELEGYEPVSFQFKVHSEAPRAGIISRDSFVALTSTMSHLLLTTIFADAYQVPASDFLTGLSITDLKSIIGTADLELNMFMTDEGLQFEIVNTGTNQRNRFTQTWEEVYAS